MSFATSGFNTATLRKELVTGADSATSIAVADITTDDVLFLVMEFAVTSNDLTDRTSQFTIHSAGNIQNASFSTANDKLLVVWFKRNASESA